MKAEPKEEFYGLLAEFETPEELVHAAERASKAGYKKMDAYSPFPIEGLHEALHLHKNILPLLVLLGGIAGAIAGFGMQYYASVIDYPYNVGGRPFNSWPAFIPVTFELTILFASLTAIFGMLALYGLPMPYHPVFNVDRFALASKDRFYLCIESADTLYEPKKTRDFLQSLKPHGVYEVKP